MGLRGIENSVTTFKDVFVPNENVIAGEGKGLKIALGTLNTGRLSLPAICVGATKYSLKIAREWANERKQWGQPLGKHDPVAQKLAFIAGTAFGLEAMVDVSSRLADDKRATSASRRRSRSSTRPSSPGRPSTRWSRSAAAAATRPAKSLAARGEKPVPAEQMLRDMRINRIFEGSTEIMHLMIAREAVDQHLSIAGDILLGDGGLAEKAKLGVKAGRVLREVVPVADGRQGAAPDVLRRVRRPGQAPALRRALLAQARALDVLRDGPLPGQARAEGRAAGPHRRHRRRALRDLLRVHVRDDARPRADRAERATPSSSWPTCSASRPAAARTACSTSCSTTTTTRSTTLAQEVLDGRYEFFEDDVLDPAGDGPMIPEHEPTAEEKLAAGGRRRPVAGARRLVVAAWVAEEVLPNVAEWDREDVLPDGGAGRGSSRSGVTGALVPAAYGGPGLGVADLVPVWRALSQGWISLTGAVNPTGLATALLVRHGTDAQRERWLPAIGRGEALASFSITEPQAGSDLSPHGDGARPTHPDGGLVLDGTKRWVAGGASAPVVFMLAAVDGERSCVVLPADGRGGDGLDGRRPRQDRLPRRRVGRLPLRGLPRRAAPRCSATSRARARGRCSTRSTSAASTSPAARWGSSTARCGARSRSAASARSATACSATTPTRSCASASWSRGARRSRR